MARATQGLGFRPPPRCPVLGRAWPAGHWPRRRLRVPRRYAVRSAGPQRRRRWRRWTESRLRPTCCLRLHLGSAVESPCPRQRVRRRPTRPLLSLSEWLAVLRRMQQASKAPGPGERTTREAPRWRAALVARRAGTSRWRASGTVVRRSRSVAVLDQRSVCPRTCRRSVWWPLTSSTSCRRGSCCTCGRRSARSVVAWACMTAIARGTGGIVAGVSSGVRVPSGARSSLA